MGIRSKGHYLRGLKALSNRQEHLLVASVALIVVASIIFELANGNPAGPTAGGSPDAAAIWHGWGMSIQPPPGVPAQYSGVGEPNATSDSGLVQWVWNGTSLNLMWATAAQSEIHPGLLTADEVQQGTGMTHVVLGAGGNIKMNGAVWDYQTYSGLLFGETTYATAAASYYSASHRIYILVFVDNSPATLSTLASYGRTFQG